MDLRAPEIACLMYNLSMKIIISKNTYYPGEINFLCVENCLGSHVSICRVAGNFHRWLTDCSLEFTPAIDGLWDFGPGRVQVHTDRSAWDCETWAPPTIFLQEKAQFFGSFCSSLLPQALICLWSAVRLGSVQWERMASPAPGAQKLPGFRTLSSLSLRLQWPRGAEVKSVLMPCTVMFCSRRVRTSTQEF